jgi:hypothetical protein
VNRFDILESSFSDEGAKSPNYAPTVTPVKPSAETINITSTPPSTKEFSHSEEKPYEIQSSEEKPYEIEPSEGIPFEKSTPENHLDEPNTREKDPYDTLSPEIRPPEISTHDKVSNEISSSAIKSSEIEPPPPEKEADAAEIPQNEEQLSLQEWTEILRGRIAQVKESIEEETTPWKTKNKKKVLEKLENHLGWITGPSVDENFFVSRKLPFFQTVRKQYELMKKVKTQRQTMKSSDSGAHVGEDLERAKGRPAKEVEVSKQKKEAKKKAVKCKAKG